MNQLSAGNALLCYAVNEAKTSQNKLEKGVLRVHFRFRRYSKGITCHCDQLANRNDIETLNLCLLDGQSIMIHLQV